MRESENLFERLKKLPDDQKARAILLVAAQKGLTSPDLVGIVVKITGAKDDRQAREVAPTWARLLGMSPKRFVELAATFF